MLIPRKGWVDGWIGGFGTRELMGKWMMYAHSKERVGGRVNVWILDS